MNLPSIQAIPRMLEKAIENARRLEEHSATNWEQIPFEIKHFLHAGMYCRTLTMPADTILTGALIKIETIVIFSGNVLVYTGNDFMNLIGHHAVPAAAYRKQVIVAAEKTSITMLFPTTVKTAKEAEEQFTDEFKSLSNRKTEV